MKRIILLTLLLSISTNYLQAQEKIDSLDFNQALKMAFTNNAGLEAREDAIRSGEFSIEQVKSSYYPKLSLYSTYTRVSKTSSIEIPNPSTGRLTSIQFNPLDRYDFGVALSHEIFTFGRRPALKRISTQSVESAKLDREDHRRMIFDNTVRAFAAMLLAKENLSTQSDNIKRASEKVEIIKSRIEQGQAIDLDRLRTELLQSQFMFNYNSAMGDYNKARESLKAIIGLSTAGNFEPLGSLEEIMIAIPETLVYEPETRNEFKRLNIGYSIQQENLSVAKSSYFPSLFLNAKYDWQNGYQPDLNKIESSWNLGLSLNWLIFDGFNRKGQLSYNRSEMKKISNFINDLKPQIRSQIQSASIDLETVTNGLDLARRQLILAQKALEIAEARFNEGLILTSDLIDSEIDLSNAEQGLHLANYKIIMAKLTLKSAIGYLS